jgi:putative sigma-54 modulation protein
MNIDIKALGFSLTEGLRAHVADRMNGPRGGIDKRCQLQLLIDGNQTVVVQDHEADLYLAVNRATDRAAHSLARLLRRSRTLVDRRSAAEVP